MPTQLEITWLCWRYRLIRFQSHESGPQVAHRQIASSSCHVSSNMFGATMSSIIAGARNKRRKPDSSAGRVLLPQRKKSRAHLQLLMLPRDLLAQMVTNPLLIECSTQSQLKGRQRMLMMLRATSQILSQLTGTIKVDSWTCAGARNMELALSWVVSRSAPRPGLLMISYVVQLEWVAQTPAFAQDVDHRQHASRAHW